MRTAQSQRRRGSRLLILAILSSLIGLSLGCGDGPSLKPVKGHVTMNGQPLTKGHITFHPNKDKGNTFGQVCVGEIDAQGEYTLQTRGKPGAPPGWYKVTVSATEAPPDNTKLSKGSSVGDTTYVLPELTPLEKEVVANAQPGAYDIKVGP
jgi:hypothetical protein